MATTNSAVKKEEQAVEQPQEQQTRIETQQPQEQRQPITTTQSVPQIVQQPEVVEQPTQQITEQPAVVEQQTTQQTTEQPIVEEQQTTTTEQQQNESTPTTIDTTANRNAAAKSVYDFYRNSGQISNYNGIDYIMQNGKAIPLFKDKNTMLGIDGKYHSFGEDGNLSNDEYVSQYNFTPGGEELLNNAFDYFDAHNGDTKSIYNTDFLKTEGGTSNMYDLATSFDINTRKWGWKKELLNRIKEEYNKRNSGTTEAQNLFDQNNMPVVAEPVVNKTADGNDDTITPEEANEFFKMCKQFHTTQRDNPSMYSTRQQYVKDFQKYMADFMEKHPALKERVQQGISWTGKNGEKFPVDGNYGQNTTSVMFHMLDMIGGEDAVNAFGGQYNPATDNYEPFETNDSAREYMEGLGLTADERHEKKRLERVQRLQNFSNLLSGVGDTIAASQGVQVKDKTQDIAQEAELLEQKKIDNEKTYKARMDELKKRFDDARTEKQKQMIAIAMEREKMAHDSKENEKNRQFQTAQDDKKLAWEGEKTRMELANALKIAREHNASAERMNNVASEAQVAAAGGSLKTDTVCALGSNSVYVRNEERDRFYNSVASAGLKRLIPNGLKIDEVPGLVKAFNNIGHVEPKKVQKIIEDGYNAIANSPLESFSINGGTMSKKELLDYYEYSINQLAAPYQPQYNSAPIQQQSSSASWRIEDM